MSDALTFPNVIEIEREIYSQTLVGKTTANETSIRGRAEK